MSPECPQPGLPLPSGAVAPPEATVPPVVRAVAAGRTIRLVWLNELGGRTFDVGAGPGRCFVKWTPTASGIDLGAEADRLEWARAFTPVPRLLDRGRDDTGGWLVTAPLPGASAVTDQWLARPRTAVTAIGAGLRALHEALPVVSCPFSWSATDRLGKVRGRVADGLVSPADWHEDHAPLGLDRALDLLADPPPADRLVVCHGDSCAPNTLLTDDGNWSGHVDLGDLGVADRWADLAIATWSTQWNYGPGWEDVLLTAYGVGADPARTRYYRLLWDLGP